MRLLVCGGREFQDAAWLRSVLDATHPCRIFTADWDTHGRAAGPIRNKRMLDEAAPDLVIAFPGGRGTADMIGRARNAGVPVQVVGLSL